jgi:hypothetical protein
MRKEGKVMTEETIIEKSQFETSQNNISQTQDRKSKSSSFGSRISSEK